MPTITSFGGHCPPYEEFHFADRTAMANERLAMNN